MPLIWRPHVDLYQWAKLAFSGFRKNYVLEAAEATKKGVVMKGFVQDIEGLAVKNNDFRQVLYTAKNCQLVVMALKPKEEIGAEVHKLDQFFRVEEGTGEAVLDGVRTAIRAGFAVLVPAGANHNIINTGTVPLKLYTLYAPPNHRDGIVHHTRADAEADSEHFDGATTE
jgi:mannose-6-phosphate isomerase-like protein (cupin superfamily)